MNTLNCSDQNVNGVYEKTSSRGYGNTPLKHRVDIERRILSKQFSDLSVYGQNSCPIGGVSVNLDYLQCTGLITADHGGYEMLDKLLSFIRSFLDVSLIDTGKPFHNGSWDYQYKYTSVNGVIFAYGFFPEGLRYYLQLPGIPLRMLEVIQWKALISGLFFDFSANFTRLDICVDDYKRRITGQKLVQLAQKGDVARVLKYFYIESGLIGNPGETTVYFGSGRKQLYFYNAEFLHKIPADRWESRFREKKAHLIASNIAEFEYSFGEEGHKELTQDEILERMLRYMGSVCLGCVDFVHRSGRKQRSLNEFSRYRFWNSLIEDVGGIQHVSVPVPKLDVVKFVAKTVKWLDRSVFKRLASLHVSFGKDVFSDYLDQEIRLASSRFNDYDFDWIGKTKDLFDSLDPDTNLSKLGLINVLKFT